MIKETEKSCMNIKLTHWMRRDCMVGTSDGMIEKYNANPYIGGLPPQLCAVVPSDRRADATYNLCHQIDNIFAKRNQIERLDKDISTYLASIADIFNTPCKLQAMGVRSYGFSPWSGAYGVVVKISFPEIKVSYALKLFLDHYDGHSGAMYEIPTAFAAVHAEPRYNCPVYLASLASSGRWMLSLWGGDVPDGKIRESKNKKFVTSAEELEKRNWRKGQRIDFGETYQTEYGKAAYRVRKMYRQLVAATGAGDKQTVRQLYINNRTDWNKAVDLADDDMRRFVQKCTRRLR